SDTTSLPEVTGEAALYSSPKDLNKIADNMLLLEKDNELRQKLIEAGKIQQNKFSWDISADRLWNCIEKAVM
ncbi:MAG: glycosyltransferase family 1 protein, partial [Bacteroidales bacterium]|nr:glycosyltransferase family 1 protein [Bacteroidales bacterium]